MCGTHCQLKQNSNLPGATEVECVTLALELGAKGQKNNY